MTTVIDIVVFRANYLIIFKSALLRSLPEKAHVFMMFSLWIRISLIILLLRELMIDDLDLIFLPGGERVKVSYFADHLLLVRSTVRLLNFYCMRTNGKVKKKSTVRRPDVRSLKIQPKYRVDQWRDATVAPEIRLCGAWLEQLGFHCGKRVTVTTMKELLIITVQSEESPI